MTSPLRDISLILLCIEAMMLALVPLAAIIAAWWGVRWLRQKLPPILARVRRYVTLVRLYAERASAAVVAPLIAVYVLAAQLRAWWDFLIGLVQEKN